MPGGGEPQGLAPGAGELPPSLGLQEVTSGQTTGCPLVGVGG